MNITNAEEAARLTEKLCEMRSFSYDKKQWELASVRSKRYTFPHRKTIIYDEVGPEKTYTNHWLKLSNQRDGQKLESKARFKPGEPSKSHEERTHDRYTEELNTEFRQWNLPKPRPPKVKLETLFGDPLEWLEWSGFFTATVHA